MFESRVGTSVISCLALGAACCGNVGERLPDGWRKAGTTACGREMAAILGESVWEVWEMRGKETVGVCGGVVTVFLRVETGWLVGIVISGALVL